MTLQHCLFLTNTQISILAQHNTPTGTETVFSKYRGRHTLQLRSALLRQLQKPTRPWRRACRCGRSPGLRALLLRDRLPNPWPWGPPSTPRVTLSPHRPSSSGNPKSEAKPSSFPFDSLSPVILIDVLHINWNWWISKFENCLASLFWVNISTEVAGLPGIK